MNIDEILNYVEFGIKRYRNDETGRKMNLLEYFCFTDLTPKELGKVARSKKRVGLAICLKEFEDACYWHLRPLEIEKRMKLFFSINDRELTPEDKLTMRDKLAEEGFPLCDGVFDFSARYYIKGGAEAISKEQIRNNIISKYNEYYDIFPATKTEEINKVLMK